MTDEELLANPKFLAMCSAWQRDGRAFFGFADKLEEWGLIGEARAWTWAAMEPDRLTEKDMTVNYDGRTRGGIRPFARKPEGPFVWWCDRTHLRASVGFRMRLGHSNPEFPTFPAAILWFLRRSDEVYGDAGPPRSALEAVA